MDLQRAKELLSSLANGIDPFTGEPLPEDSVCNKTEIVRAIHCVLRELTAKQSKPAKPRPENEGKSWMEEEDRRLAEMYDAGSTRREMCDCFKRTPSSVASRLVRLGKIRDWDEFYERR